MNKTKHAKILLMAVAVTCCKPPGSASNVASITGIDSNGQSSAFTMLPLRNFVDSSLGSGSQDPGVQQAAAMSKYPAAGDGRVCILFYGKRRERARCRGDAGAAIDDLYVDANRHLMISADDAHLAQIGNGASALAPVPCHLYGQRLLSWDVLVDIQARAAGFAQPAQAAVSGKMQHCRQLHIALVRHHPQQRGVGCGGIERQHHRLARIPIRDNRANDQARFGESGAPGRLDVHRVQPVFHRVAGLETWYCNPGAGKGSITFPSSLFCPRESTAKDKKLPGFGTVRPENTSTYTLD